MHSKLSAAVVAAAMGAAVMGVGLLPLNPYLGLLIQAPVGALIYALGAKLLRIDSFEYILSILNLLKKDVRD